VAERRVRGACAKGRAAMSILALAQQIADLNRRIAESADTDLAPSEKPEDPAARRRRACRAARHLTRFTMTRSGDARDAWQAVVEILGDGTAAEEARELVQTARTIIDSWLTLSQKARAVWQGVAAETGASPEGLEELAAEEERVKELRATVEKTHAFLSDDRRPVDLARLQKGREDMAQGRFKKPEEMHALFQVPQK
jgi:hypothetical protein